LRKQRFAFATAGWQPLSKCRRAASQHGARRKHLSGGRALGAKKRSGPNSLRQPGYRAGRPNECGGD